MGKQLNNTFKESLNDKSDYRLHVVSVVFDLPATICYSKSRHTNVSVYFLVATASPM
jgi:hypothetical protein